MADGTRVPSHGCWIGDIKLGGQTVRTQFEIFPSGGGWSLLFGKPLLQQFQAVHDYGNDTLMIPLDGEWSTLTNEYGREYTAGSQLLTESKETSRGDDDPPSRQVSSPNVNILEQIDKQEPLEITTFITEHEPLNIPKLSK